LSYALFPQVAEKFFEKRNNPKTEEPAKSQNSNETRTIYVEDISE